jgi:hypothetical protein
LAETLSGQLHRPNEYRIYYHCPACPGPDQMLMGMCEQIRIVSVRKNGNLHDAIRRRCSLKTGTDALTPPPLCLVDASLTPTDLHNDLRELGCLDWWLYQQGSVRVDDRSPRTTAIAEAAESRQLPPIVSLDQMQGEFLSHWTRGLADDRSDRVGNSPWEAVWFGDPPAEGPLGGLLQILGQQTILASGKLIRGGRPMCCFTEVPLDQFSARRVFRPHLSRWDFEPFGVAVRRAALELTDARPVQYLARSAIGKIDRETLAWVLPGDARTDWRGEREWRVAGNVDLRQFPVEDVFVFVPDQKCAERIRPFSRWPIINLAKTPAGSSSRSSH